MATSTIPAAIDALLAAVTAALAAAGDTRTKVVDGFPRFSIADTDFIAVGGKGEPVADGEQTAATLGARKREERYRLRLYCSSSRGGSDQKVVRDRAFALMAVVEDVVRTNITLGGAVRDAQVAGAVQLNETDFESAPKGVFAEVAFDLACTARI